MQISVYPGQHRNEHFYTFKDLHNNLYVNATWSKSKNNSNYQELCTYFSLGAKVTKITTDYNRAQERFRALIEKINNDLELVQGNPPSYWRENNINKLTRLLNGELRLVKINFSLSTTENIV